MICATCGCVHCVPFTPKVDKYSHVSFLQVSFWAYKSVRSSFECQLWVVCIGYRWILSNSAMQKKQHAKYECSNVWKIFILIWRLKNSYILPCTRIAFRSDSLDHLCSHTFLLNHYIWDNHFILALDKVIKIQPAWFVHYIVHGMGSL